MSHFTLQLVEDMEFDVVLTWAETFAVPFDTSQWLDDDWVEMEDALRVAVAEAMENIGK